MDELKQKLETLQGKMTDLQEKTLEYVAEHPTQALGIVFGIGVVAGVVIAKLLERK